MPGLYRTDKVVYPIKTNRGVVEDLARVRALVKRRTGQNIAVNGWFAAFVRENLTRLEAQERASPTRAEAGPAPEPFRGLPDDACSVD